MSDLLRTVPTNAQGSSATPTQPGDAQRRLRGAAIAALLVAALTHTLIVGIEPATLLGVPLSTGIVVGLLALPLVMGGAAIARKSLPLVGATVLLFVAGALTKGPWEVTPLRLLVALVDGFAILAFVEFTHMLVRHQRLAAAVNTSAGGDARLAHAMREYIRTFASTAGIAALACAGVATVLFLMRYLGPEQWRASFDLASVWGLVAVTLIAILAAALVALARASDLRLPERRPPQPPNYQPATSTPEADADAPE